MKDENGREYSDYDIDKLIEEYSHINRNDEPEQASQPPREKKKFVVHIDESLIDDSPQSEEPKPQSGGIYFSNYPKHRRSPDLQEEPAAEPEHKHMEKKAHKVMHGSRENAVKKVKNEIEKVGGKAAVGFQPSCFHMSESPASEICSQSTGATRMLR